MGAALFFVAFAAIVVAAIWYGVTRKRKRRRAIEQTAANLGLQYSTKDPYNVLSLPFTLLSEGDGRGCENVVSGSYKGIDVKEFDYWYYTESSNGRGGSSRSYHYFSCAATEIPVNCARVSISRESWLTRLGDHLGLKDIQFESEQFNRDYRVMSKDTKFATDLVDARMMQWLEVGTGWSFEVHGPNLLATSKRLEADTIFELLDVLRAFRDHIPRVVYDLYGTKESTAEETSTQ
jgi:hypothetical protein